MKKLILLLSGVIILYANNKDECIKYSKNSFTLRVDNKITNLKFYSNYVLINDKYKAYYEGKDVSKNRLCYLEPTEVYKNKKYIYKIGQCLDADSYFINITNIYGLNTTIQCSW